MTIFAQLTATGVVNGLIYALIAFGFIAIYRVTNVVNFAQGEFLMLGGFLALVAADWGLPWPIALIGAVLVTGLLGAVMHRTALQPAGRNASVESLVIITIGMSFLLRGVAQLIWGSDALPVPPFTDADPVRMLGFSLAPQAIWILLFVPVVTALLWLFFTRTTLGLSLRACAQNRSGADLVGIDSARMGRIAFALGCGLAGLAGVLLTPLSFVSFGVGVLLGFKGFTAAILGGLRSFTAAAFGGIALGLLESYSAGYISSAYRDAVTFVVLLVVLVFRPQGFVRGGGHDHTPIGGDATADTITSGASGLRRNLPGIAVVAVLVFLMPYFFSRPTLSTFVFAGLFAVVSIGVVLLLGYTGQISLGHASLMGIGGVAPAGGTPRPGGAPVPPPGPHPGNPPAARGGPAWRGRPSPCRRRRRPPAGRGQAPPGDPNPRPPRVGRHPGPPGRRSPPPALRPRRPRPQRVHDPGSPGHRHSPRGRTLAPGRRSQRRGGAPVSRREPISTFAAVQRDLFDDDHEMFRDSVRRFIAAEVAPHNDEWEQAGVVDRSLFTSAGKHGFLGMAAPVEHGGGGVDDFRYNLVIAEEIQRAGVNAAGLGWTLHNDICLPYFLSLCTDEQQARWLPGICSGELVTAIAMTEPGIGSDLASMTTTARRDGDVYVVNGSKTFITNGINADLVITAVKTDPSERHRGMSLVVVERGMPGFERGRNLDKIGMHAQDTAELFFTDVRVPVDNRLGEEGAGFRFLVTNLPQERLSIATTAVDSGTVPPVEGGTVGSVNVADGPTVTVVTLGSRALAYA